MERNRYIHSLRESSYKIKIEGRRPDEDLTVNVYGMDGEIRLAREEMAAKKKTSL